MSVSLEFRSPEAAHLAQRKVALVKVSRIFLIQNPGEWVGSQTANQNSLLVMEMSIVFLENYVKRVF